MNTKSPEPNWQEWLHIPDVRVWEACALSLNVDPHSLKTDRNGWLAGPGHGPFFEGDSFSNEQVKDEFESRRRILQANLGRSISPTIIDAGVPGNTKVSLTEFAAWATNEVHWEALPEPLSSLAHDEEEAESSALDNPAFMAAFKETVYNDKAIDWEYWVHKMPKLSAAQAARLLSGLDPDIFENLSSRPNRNDPTQPCQKARSIQRLAEAENKLTASPKEWLEWTETHGFQVHDGFSIEVDNLNPVTAEEPDATAARPMQTMEAQEKAILRALKEAGYDPLALPDFAPGKPGVKAAIRKRLTGTRLFISGNAFKHAWDRLKGAGDIQYRTKG